MSRYAVARSAMPPALVSSESHSPLAPEDYLHPRQVLNFMADQWRLVLGTTLLALFLGGAYVLCAPPIYTASLLVQIDGLSTGLLPLPSNMTSERSTTNDEMEVLRSRRVVGAAVDAVHDYIEVHEQHLPVVGAAFDRLVRRLAALGLPLAVGPANSIEVASFDVPQELQQERFVLTTTEGGYFRLEGKGLPEPLEGKAGTPLRADVSGGPLSLTVASLAAARGSRFDLRRHARLDAIEDLQKRLKIGLRGKQSNVIEVALHGKDRNHVTATVSAIGSAYLQHNSSARSDDAAKKIAVIEAQLPTLKQEMVEAERRYNAARHRHGTVDLDAESKALLQRSIQAQERLENLRQKREELLSRYTPEHELVRANASQLRSAQAQLDEVKTMMSRKPQIEQDVMQLERDLKVRTEMFSTVLLKAQQLRLENASRIGSANLIDDAQLPSEPTSPRPLLALSIAACIGLLLGTLIAYLRRILIGRVEDPFSVEEIAGAPVSALIPFEKGAARRMRARQPDPPEEIVESMQRFLTILRPAVDQARNNVVLLTGPTAMVGKSFVTVNLARVLAASGQRVLLVDGDLRADDLRKHFGAPAGPGLADILEGTTSVDLAIRSNVLERVDLLSAGRTVQQPATLLGRHSLHELLERLSLTYDYVLIDSAPVLAVSDALLIGRQAGTIFQVVRAGWSTADQVGEVAWQFRQAKLELAGLVFNGVRSRFPQYRYDRRSDLTRYQDPASNVAVVHG